MEGAFDWAAWVGVGIVYLTLVIGRYVALATRTRALAIKGHGRACAARPGAGGAVSAPAAERAGG